jgi:divinyl chlorophyllide a 8-vinyl-reductase
VINGSAKSVLVAGASGYIGKAVVAELVEQGFEVYALVRKNTKLEGSNVSNLNIIAIDTGAEGDWTQKFPKVDVIISCLASRSGRAKDANYVDYGLNSDLLSFACKTKVQHFILLSAICTQKPLLAFQYAKLKFQTELMSSGIRYSIVLPTAFFKSLSGQITRIKQGKSFLVFGSGRQTSSLPISEIDLAKYLSNCISHIEFWNKSLPVGGPGPVITPLDQV